MDVSFWQQRWSDNQIGFHLDTVNPVLLAHWSRIAPPPPATIFMPLAGKSLDMIWLISQGYQVISVEVSEIAVAAFFRENDIPCEVQTRAGHTVWLAPGLRMICSDFFALTPADLEEDIDLVYDRAAYIAMPDTLRTRYCEQLAGLCPASPRLLVTLEYDQAHMSGPPFAVAAAEVEQQYAHCANQDYKVTRLARTDVLPDHAHFMARGVSHLHECVYYLST